MNEKLYLPAPFFALRAPFWALEDYEQILKERDLMKLYQSSAHLREAISIASPDLHRSLEQFPLNKQTAMSLLNYVVRMSTRATPFGLFAFMGMGSWGKTTSEIDLKLIAKKERPDMESVYNELQKQSVRANPLAQLRGNRMVLKNRNKEISVRANELVKAILKVAIEPIGRDVLWKCLSTLMPVLAKEKTMGVIEELLQQQMLLPGKLPSLFNFPFQEGPLQIDASYQGHFHLPESVAEELEGALSLLWKISSTYSKGSSLDHQKFLERYGTYRTVPLMEFLSEDPFQKGEAFSETWEKFLSQQWQKSLYEKKKEIVLTEEVVNQLGKSPVEAPPSLEVFCKIFAESSEHVDRGEFDLLFSQLNLMGGSSFGRFLYLFDRNVQDQLQEYFQKEEQLEPGALFFEVSYWPSSPHFANVLVRPCLRALKLDLQDENSLSLDDIYVGVTEDRFYLTLKEGGCELIPRAANMLNPAHGPLFAQFIHAVAQERHAELLPFSWGKLEKEGIFLPRVRFGKVILSPAKWNLDGTPFVGQSDECIIAKFLKWANEWDLPFRFQLKKEDQYLLLDRSHPAHLSEIATKLKMGKSLQFVEEDGHAWLKSERGHHLAEFVIPFLKNLRYANNNPLKPPPYHAISTKDRWRFPGSEWLYVKFYLEDEDNFLIQHLAPFADQLGDWYFVRYADPKVHIRFRLKFPPADILFRLEEATQGWMEKGLIKNMAICPYEREIERYGGLEQMEEMEALFCADTKAVIQLLRSTRWDAPILHTLSVISLVKEFNLKPEELFRLLGGKQNSQGFRTYKKQLLSLLDAPLYQASLAKVPPVLEIYDSILHMHCNRLGCDLEAEKRARSYAYHLKHSWGYNLSNARTIILTS